MRYTTTSRIAVWISCECTLVMVIQGCRTLCNHATWLVAQLRTRDVEHVTRDNWYGDKSCRRDLVGSRISEFPFRDVRCPNKWVYVVCTAWPRARRWVERDVAVNADAASEDHWPLVNKGHRTQYCRLVDRGNFISVAIYAARYVASGGVEGW